MVQPPINNGWDAWNGTQIRTSEFGHIVDYLINRDSRISSNCYLCGKIIPAGTVFIRPVETANHYCDRHCFKKAMEKKKYVVIIFEEFGPKVYGPFDSLWEAERFEEKKRFEEKNLSSDSMYIRAIRAPNPTE